METIFYNIYTYIASRKIWSAGVLLAFVFGLIFLVTKLQFEEDITKLIPLSDESKELQKVLKSANFSDKIIVNIQVQPDGSFEDLSDFASQFIDSILKSSEGYITNIQGKVTDDDLLGTIDFVYQNLPIFLNEDDYKTLGNKISRDSIDAITVSNYKSILSPSGIITKNTIIKDPLGISLIALKKMQQLNIGDDFTLQDNFVVTRDKKNL